MAEKINIEELKVMIANEIKNEGLNEVLDGATIDKIVKDILYKQNMDNARNAIPEIIPEQTEGPPMAAPTNAMPTETGDVEVPTNKYYTPSIDADNFGTGITNSTTQIDQSTSGNIPAYTPELPSFLNKIEPAKVIVFDMNELSHGGENLTNAPLRTFENPDVKKSMNDFWVNEGKKKAEVYMAKFEKIGEIEFNYVNGTSQFVEKRFDPDFEAQAKYKENPYGAPSLPQTTGTDNSNIMAQISTAVDLEAIVTKIVKDLIQKGMMGGSTVDSSPKKYAFGALDPNNPNVPTDNMGHYIAPKESYGYDQSQAVRPMEESNRLFKGNGDITELNAVAFDLNMAKLVDDNGSFVKSELPEALKEYIGAGRRDFLKNENQEVEEWHFDGTSYFLPKNRISKNKGYIVKK
jgi:hypothetical protein